MEQINNWVIVSDLHCGCRLGLCPPRGVKLDDGGKYKPSKIQKKIWKHWDEFWNKWIPTATKGEEFGIIINGDIVDGVHHGSTTQVSQNIMDQATIAYEIMMPLVERAQGRLYMIRGTEAHVGKSGVNEESIAQKLGAIANEEGQAARYELWKEVGSGLVHIMHHIGTTGSQAYEATAVHKELVEEFTEAGRWGERPPDIVIRSHRHRYIRTEIGSHIGNCTAAVTPGWQAKTPFAWKIAGARLSPPQFGGILIRQGDEDLFVRHKVWTLSRSKVE